MKKLLKQVWSFLNGKKRNIGIAMMIAGTGSKVFGLLPNDQAEFVTAVGGAVAGFGWAHSVVKDEKSMKTINSALNKVKLKK